MSQSIDRYLLRYTFFSVRWQRLLKVLLFFRRILLWLFLELSF
ncbi:hypothetical protein C4J90_1868 [Pseudomonas sp. R2-60-08W]|nr:hypothetical protein C4J90_1868 [Pseudomonas sp. R2-60-08W]